jgi:P27 family predicted phage terminase small subunit
MGETDCDALGRYIAAQSLYGQAVKDLRAVNKQRPKAADAAGLAVWADMLDTLDKRVDRYFKQCRSAASDLGLTISSRCKLVVPVKDEDEKPESKFAKFRVVGEA